MALTMASAPACGLAICPGPRFARDLRAMVWSTPTSGQPWILLLVQGLSGYGRETGRGDAEYTDAKAVWINVDADISPFYLRG
jgi:hypothetical protein